MCRSGKGGSVCGVRLARLGEIAPPAEGRARRCDAGWRAGVARLEGRRVEDGCDESGWAVRELKGPNIYLGFIEDKMLGMWAQRVNEPLRLVRLLRLTKAKRTELTVITSVIKGVRPNL
jgi:hypothetical protein